jgi:hypothetical protein
MNHEFNKFKCAPTDTTFYHNNGVSHYKGGVELYSTIFSDCDVC